MSAALLVFLSLMIMVSCTRGPAQKSLQQRQYEEENLGKTTLSPLRQQQRRRPDPRGYRFDVPEEKSVEERVEQRLQHDQEYGP